MNVSSEEMYRMLSNSDIDDIVAIIDNVIDDFDEERSLIVFSDYKIEDEFIRLNSPIFMKGIKSYGKLYTGWIPFKRSTMLDLTIFLIRKGKLYIFEG